MAEPAEEKRLAERKVVIARGTEWTVTVENDRLTITGGTFIDAYAPVEVSKWRSKELIADIQLAVEQAR